MEVIKFDDFKYGRPNYHEIESKVNVLLERLKKARTFDEYKVHFKKLNDLEAKIETLFDYADIRNMRDASDDFYQTEITYWNEFKNKYDLLFIPFYRAYLDSPYQEELANVLPPNFAETIKAKMRITSKKATGAITEENKLKQAYRAIVAEKIEFDGEDHNLNYILSKCSDADRKMRNKAHAALNDFFYLRQEKLDDIMFNLLKLRQAIAHDAGYESYVEYSLDLYRRFDYNYRDIAQFREYIRQYVTPICTKINNYRKEQLGLEKLEYYDTLFFTEMPKLKYYDADLLANFTKVLDSISLELRDFYQTLLDNGYIDFLPRDNKVLFSITNYLVTEGIPVITGNFHHRYSDLRTLSHEFGHAYQKYNASLEDKGHIVSPILKYPTFDIAEMFSYAMELIIMNHAQKLFDPADYQKYCFLEMADLVTLLPYICLVDEFQEQIYSQKSLKREDIRKIWLNLAHKYGLDESYDGHINLQTGGYFYRQSHIFLNPFYYIDYALAYFGAFAIAEASREDLTMFKQLGSVASYYSLDVLTKKYGLANPFDEQAVAKLAKTLDKKIDNIYKNL